MYARLLIVAAEIFLQIKKKMFPAEIKCSTTFYVWFIHRDLLPATKHAPLFFLMSMYYPLKNHKGGRHYLPSRFNSFYILFYLSSISHLITCTDLLNYQFSNISTLFYSIKVESLNYSFFSMICHIVYP